MSLIKCSNIEFKYDGKQVLKDISFEINNGDYICIIGENGTGKSTLLNIVSGVLKPTSGSIEYVDESLKKKIGYLPQQNQIQDKFPASVYEVVLSGCVNKLKFSPFYTRKEKQIAIYNMNLLEIYDIRNKSFHELSGGQKQRVLLARALCSAENLILLDEPSSGLDPVVTESFYNTIHHLNTEHSTTIVMVSHDIDKSLQYATHVLYLKEDSFYYGKKSDFLKSGLLKSFIGGNDDV